MDLQQLLARAQEIEVAVINMTSQLNALHGHKTEIAHWIQQVQLKEDETQVEPQVEPVEETMVAQHSK